MFLKINTFKRLIKTAWKGMGLTVGNDGEGIYLVGNHWSIWLAKWEMTNKAKAAIIELTGGLPSEGTAYKAWEGEGVQFEMTELYDPEIYRPEIRNFKIEYQKTGVTRNGKQYKKEMADKDHEELLEALKTHKGPALISGYDTKLYRDMLKDWHREEINNRTQACSEKREILWMNFRPEWRQMELLI